MAKSPRALSAKEIDAIHVAELRHILDALERHRAAKRASEPDRPPRLIWAGDIKPLPHWQAKMNRAAKDGVEQSLLASIRELGWQAWAAGGNDAMLDLVEAATDGQANSPDAITVYHAWDEIGAKGKGRWYV